MHRFFRMVIVSRGFIGVTAPRRTKPPRMTSGSQPKPSLATWLLRRGFPSQEVYTTAFCVLIHGTVTWKVKAQAFLKVETLWWSFTWWRYDRPDLHENMVLKWSHCKKLDVICFFCRVFYHLKSRNQKLNQMLEVKDAPEIITRKFTQIESLTLPAFQKCCS